jgi:hypothetical protein
MLFMGNPAAPDDDSPSEEAQGEPVPWDDLDPEEREAVRQAFAKGDAAYHRGECIPRDQVVPRTFRRAG